MGRTRDKEVGDKTKIEGVKISRLAMRTSESLLVRGSEDDCP